VSGGRAITRRTFLGGAVVAAATAAGCAGSKHAGTSTITTRPRPDPGAARRVVVVGAGLAGLTAALDLRDAGWDVVVLEARDRLGGRVHTLRGGQPGTPFDTGLHAEAGGESIDDNHDRLRAMLRRFDIPTERRQADREQKGMIRYRGTTYPTLNFVGLRGGTVAVDYARASDELEKLAERHHLDPEHPDEADGATSLDAQSYADFLDGLHLVPEARFIVEQANTAIYATETRNLSLLFAAQQAMETAGVPDTAVETMRVSGGNDRLPRAMAASLGKAVVTNAAVTSIERRSDGVTVMVDQKPWFGAHVVVALPPPPLRRIRFAPALPAGLAAAIAGTDLGPAVKVVSQYDTPYWREKGHSGFSIGDLQYRVSWDATDSYAADAGLLTTFTTGANGLALSHLPTDERISRVQGQLEQVYPGGTAHLSGKAVSMAWPQEMFTGGAYAFYRPGQLAPFWPALRAGTDRIRFAGEHTDALAGYMESAVRSGHRAARVVGPAR
jgi:monoamine oxidase